MRPSPFFKLCEMLERRAPLINTKHMSVGEQVLIFLHLIGHNVRFRAIRGRFFHSAWTIRSYFHIVLGAILNLYPNFIESSHVTFRDHYSYEEKCEKKTLDTISKKFNAKCLLAQVDNHLRTMKTAWGIIAKLRNQSSCGLDVNMRMIRMSSNVYNIYIEGNPTHEKYLNKKIDMYDEIVIVVRKNIARGSGGKLFDDVEM
ncbi:hypothetical protein Cgig2_002053 [Carnegiea gigantea]|uniref:DUF8040 domain-containing protein n=1 Tax=Carnegiea gigantea TaxID=171969 RepID=A0A9Q1JXE8_9CARY|nr:hypothetical protein Cgig2_002053 [Carnegiea gigantea]